MSIGLVECKRDRHAVVSVERIQLETAARIENRQATIGEPRKLPAVRTKRREIPERIEKAARVDQATTERSEEHTSELQSLMRNSYAVFCSKKKNNKKQRTTKLNNN